MLHPATASPGDCHPMAQWGQVGREEGRLAGEEYLYRLPASISVSSVIILGDKICLELLCSLMGPGLIWEVRNKVVLKYQMAHPVLSSAQPFSGRECLWCLKSLSLWNMKCLQHGVGLAMRMKMGKGRLMGMGGIFQGKNLLVVQ